MAFGQTAGPPATAKQIQHLESLLLAAGHSDFRDARGPLGLTQRQAAGKFTRDEADALIEQLADEDDGPGSGADPQEAERIQALRAMPATLLADELARRGWAVIAPD